MAVNLTGMLSQLNQQFAPRQQAPQVPVEQQNLMQRSGVTNPLLQQFGRGLGGLFNIEMRSPMEIAQAEQKAQQEQARQVYSQALTASPEKQLELASQLMNISGYETAAMQLAQQAQAKLEQGQKQLEQGQQEITSSLNQTRRQQSLASAIQEKNPELASLIRQGDPDAYKRGVALLSPKEAADKASNLRFDVTEKIVDGKLKKVQIGTNPITGDIVSENVIGDVVGDDKDHKSFLETAAGSKAYNTVNTAKREADLTSAKLDNYIAATDKAVNERTGLVGGVLGAVRETVVSEIFGAGDELTVLTANLNQLRMEGALKLLPKGPASDRDVALALDASVDPKNLKGEELLSYLRGLKKANDAAREYYSAKEQWIVQTEDANALGFEQWAAVKEYNNTIEAVRSQNPEVYQKIIGRLAKASQETDPVKRQVMIDAIRKEQQQLQAEGLLDAGTDILGLIEGRGQAINTYEDVKKKRNLTSFRGL
jgi:hypothetical protein